MNEHQITVNLADIVDIEGLPDRPLDAQYVAALVATNEPDKWPPIIVYPVNGVYGRIAGKHRIAAARKLGLKQLPAIARNYPDKAAMYVDMWEDNIKNGLALTTKQRKEYALNLHRLQPDLSLRELGRRAGLAYQTVKAAIQEVENAEDEDESQTSYNQGMRDYTARLITALNQFFENERAFFGSADGKRSETARAKALATKMTASQASIATMKSLARTFEQTAQLLTERGK